MQDATSTGPGRTGGAAGSPPGSPIHGRDLLLVLVLTAGLLVLMRTLVGAPARTIEFVLLMLAAQSAIPMLAVHLVMIRGRGLAWRDIGLRRVRARWLLWGALLAVASLPLVGIVNYATQIWLGGPFRNPQIEVIAPEGFAWRGLVGMLVMAGAVAPVVEEIVFRGLLFGWLLPRVGAAAAIFLSALLFAAAHGVFHLIPALAVQGALLAILYHRSGSLWPAIVMHGAFNAIMIVSLYAALAAGVPVE